ncbi:auxin-responsive protein SAUR78-like [Vicia villosa]|uniref:auxin-responsive protein SAUR78-like n=1 Tax=Vicia villosa TaxID=3911 RepID=UPI00273CD85B|nr:auxin-responsive protein SAUR78-like [Vicia villosa]
MTKVAKLTKIKSVLKKWNTFAYYNNKHNRSDIRAVVNDDESCVLSEQGLRPVFVGKTRRRYLVNSDVVGHPLFQELVDRSRGSVEVDDDDDDDTVNVACEVVLFEHMLWMIENTDPQPESLDELVDYYSC